MTSPCINRRSTHLNDDIPRYMLGEGYGLLVDDIDLSILVDRNRLDRFRERHGSSYRCGREMVEDLVSTKDDSSARDTRLGRREHQRPASGLICRRELIGGQL